MTQTRSLAQHYRAHRQAFLLALELGCTPREAEAEMRRREAREKWRAGQDRLALRQTQDERMSCSAAASEEAKRDTGSGAQPWMMRD